MDMSASHVYKQKSTVIHELTQGLQMAEQLRDNIILSPEKRDLLIHKILSSYENALSVLHSGDSAGQSRAPARPALSPPESSMSIGSTGSDAFEFDQPFSDTKGEIDISKKRKEPVTWEDEIIRICSDNIGLDGNTDDGCNWRKYGQKDIRGTKFPRYHRCSYQKIEKCFATKQVQRTDEDATVVDVVYKGKHTCHQSVSRSPSLSSPPPSSPEKHEIMSNHHQPSSHCAGELLSNPKATLSVNTSDLRGNHNAVPSSFSCTSTTDGVIEGSQQLHSPNNYDDELFQVYSPPFISPLTSESNIFTDWGSSRSLDFLADIDTDFEFNSFF